MRHAYFLREHLREDSSGTFQYERQGWQCAALLLRAGLGGEQDARAIEKADMITEIIGLEGAENAGKSHVLRTLVKRLVSSGAEVVKVFGFDRHELENIPDEGDYIVFLRIRGEIIVVATGGDLCGWVKVVKEVIIKVSLDVRILIAAMRNSYPDVKGRYTEWAEKHGVPIRFIFKPGFKKANDEFYNERIRWAEGLWVNMLESEIKSDE